MTSDSLPGPVPSGPEWHRRFAQIIRYALAPAILLVSGFFTANFVISGQYAWPRTTRVFALTLTLLVLSYEFVYKEQRVRLGSAEQARAALFYSCVIPYAIGVVLMFVLWKM